MADLFLEKSQHVECSDPEAFRRDMASIVNRARETTLKLSKVCSSQSVLGCGDFWGTGRGCSCGGKGCPSCGGKGCPSCGLMGCQLCEGGGAYYVCV